MFIFRFTKYKENQTMSKTYEPTLHRNARGNGKSKELDVKPPKFHCNSCTKRVENRCTFLIDILNLI